MISKKRVAQIRYAHYKEQSTADDIWLLADSLEEAMNEIINMWPHGRMAEMWLSDPRDPVRSGKYPEGDGA